MDLRILSGGFAKVMTHVLMANFHASNPNPGSLFRNLSQPPAGCILPYAMTYFPQPHSRRRAARIMLPGTLSSTIRFEDGSRITGKLQTVSVTGGLLRLPKPRCPGALVEIMFLTQSGPVQGMAELLSPCSATLRCLQPFRFIMMDDGDFHRLRTVLASSLGANPASRTRPGFWVR
jgi:hypothetical protein